MGRFRELLEVVGDCPFVRDVAYMYAKGHIVTFEEALQRIICRLIGYYSHFESDYRDRLRYNVPSTIIPADKLADFQATHPPHANPDPPDGDSGG
jgi:hypothetical protein